MTNSREILIVTSLFTNVEFLGLFKYLTFSAFTPSSGNINKIKLHLKIENETIVHLYRVYSCLIYF